MLVRLKRRDGVLGERHTIARVRQIALGSPWYASNVRETLDQRIFMLDLAALVGRVLLGPVFMGQTPILLMQQGRKQGGVRCDLLCAGVVLASNLSHSRMSAPVIDVQWGVS